MAGSARRRRWWLLLERHRRRLREVGVRVFGAAMVVGPMFLMAMAAPSGGSALARGVEYALSSAPSSGCAVGAGNDPGARYGGVRIPAADRVPVVSADHPSLTAARHRALRVAAGRDGASSASCSARFVWPLADPRVISGFDPPERPWLTGHRGVDLAAESGDELVAPADGVVSFTGKVGGKDVVSIRHGFLTSTFEPAVSGLDHGAVLRQGERFALVDGVSDHCGETCVHWGVKRADGGYVDPAAQTRHRRLFLKRAP
ncbi:MAG: M23 family metallopeptidase [Bifidobacterium mongoliense]|nr:M23 family metallopeptidase [Bifidobacterium mongoliense]